MNATLDNLVRTTTRAVRDGQQITQHLRQRNIELENLGECVKHDLFTSAN